MARAGKALLDVLRDDQSTESDLVLAAELAGEVSVINALGEDDDPDDDDEPSI